MELSRREFLKGLGAIGLSALLARKHGAVRSGREGLIALGKEHGVLKPQWQGYRERDMEVEWCRGPASWDQKLRSLVCKIEPRLVVNPCTSKERVYRIGSWVGCDLAVDELPDDSFIVPVRYRPFEEITWVIDDAVMIPLDPIRTFEDACRERGMILPDSTLVQSA